MKADYNAMPSSSSTYNVLLTIQTISARVSIMQCSEHMIVLLLPIQYPPRLILVLTTLMNCVKCREPGVQSGVHTFCITVLSHVLFCTVLYCTQSCTPVLSPLSLFPRLVALIAAGRSHSKVPSHIAVIIIICYHASSLMLHTHSRNKFNST